MPIQFDCICGQRVQAPDDQEGKKVMCSRCSNMVVVPAPVENLGSCPMCGELIPEDAVKCSHCGEALDDTLLARANSSSDFTGTYKKDMLWMGNALIVIGFGVCLCAISSPTIYAMKMASPFDVLLLAIVLTLGITSLVLGICATRGQNWVNYAVALAAGGLVVLLIAGQVASIIRGQAFSWIFALVMVIPLGFFWRAVANLRLRRRIDS